MLNRRDGIVHLAVDSKKCLDNALGDFFVFKQVPLRFGIRDSLRIITHNSERLLSPDKRGAFNRSMQHHLRTDLFKDGVYDPREAVETFSQGEERHLESMEGRAVLA